MKKELGFDAGGRGASRFLPIPTDDEGKPANTPDIRITNKVYKEEEMLKVFKVVNPQRKQRKEMDFFPDLTRVNADGYFIAFDHNNTLGGKPLPVGRVGWKYMRQHGVFLTVGVKVIPMYRGLGIAKKLWEMRDRVIFRNRPAVGFLSNFKEGWINYVKSRNWNIEPPVSTLPESLVMDAEKTITERGKPRKMITYNMPSEIYEDEAMAKAWEILKINEFVDKAFFNRNANRTSNSTPIPGTQASLNITGLGKLSFAMNRNQQDMSNAYRKMYSILINPTRPERQSLFSSLLNVNQQNRAIEEQDIKNALTNSGSSKGMSEKDWNLSRNIR